MSWPKSNVREFITLTALNDSIENKNISKGLGFKDKNVLILGLFDMENAIDLEGHRLTYR
jgi:hypothetical protein